MSKVADKKWMYKYRAPDGSYCHVNIKGLKQDYLHERKLCSSSQIANPKFLAVLHARKGTNYFSDTEWNNLQELLHFGQYQHILSLCNQSGHFQGFYLYAICALEQYHEFYLTKMSQINLKQFCAPIWAIVDVMNIEEKQQHSKFIIERFIDLYVNVEMLSLIKHSSVPNKKCSENQNNKQCENCIRIDITAQLLLGYLMFFCSDIIINKLQSFSVTNLTNLLLVYYKNATNYCLSNVYSKLKRKSKLMKKWTREDMVSHGGRNMLFAISWHKTNAQNQKKCGMLGQVMTSYEFSHIRGKLLAFGECEYESANHYFVLAACSANDLYEKVISLAALLCCCYKNGQYLIGKKVLNCVYQLCNGFLLPSFDEMEYIKQRENFKTKIRVLTCSNCEETYKKLKVCKGCMKVVYCSTYCQKKHWSRIHRIECGRFEHFKMLENSIFNRL
eukprot:18912_1